MLDIPTGANGLPLQRNLLLQTRDLDEFEEKVYSSVDPRTTRLLDSGKPTEMSVSRFALKFTQFFGVSHRAAIRTASTRPLNSWQINIPVTGKLRAHHTEALHEVGRGEALLSRPGDSIDIEWADNTTALVLVVGPEAMEGFSADSIRGCALLDGPQRIVFDLSEGAGRSFANTLDLFLSEAENPTSLLGSESTAETYEKLLLASMGLMVAPSHPDQSMVRRSAILPGYVRRTVEFVKENCHKDLSIDDLVGISQVSMRSLQSGFSQHFNKGPMTFVRHLKLECAREELLAADPESVNILDVALRWGFNHQSHFAKMYFKAFGELPSETIRRSS